MTMQAHPDRLCTFVASLELLSCTAQHDAIVAEVLETGGSFTAPTGSGWDSHLFRLSLHGTTAYGGTEKRVIRNWKKAARDQLRETEDFGENNTAEIEDDGFITIHPPFPNPRNHAEEIANARSLTTHNRQPPVCRQTGRA